MSNSTAILAALNAPAYDVVRDEIRAATLAWAKNTLARYQGEVAAWISSGNYSADRKTFPRLSLPGAFLVGPTLQYAVADSGYYNARKAVIASQSINEVEVLKAADQEWEDTKAFYAARVGEKADLIGGDAEIALDVTIDRELVGRCTAVLGEKVLVLNTSCKTNYRYGENAADGHLTIYRQVPTLVESAKGFDPVAVEQAKAAAAADAKADRKAKIEDLKNRIDNAEKRKRRIDDLYGTLQYVAKYHNGVAINGNKSDIEKLTQELGLAGVPDLSTAKAMVLSIRDVVKSLKADLKTAKVAK